MSLRAASAFEFPLEVDNQNIEADFRELDADGASDSASTSRDNRNFVGHLVNPIAAERPHISIGAAKRVEVGDLGLRSPSARWILKSLTHSCQPIFHWRNKG